MEPSPVLPANEDVIGKMPNSIQTLFKAQADAKSKVESDPQVSSVNDPKIQDAYQVRKKESFAQLKKWDDKRTLFLNTHRNLLEGILIKMDKKIKQSDSSIQTIVQFFKDRISQESEYIKSIRSKMVKLNTLWKEGQKDEIPIYPGLNKAFNEIDDMHVKKASGLQDYLNFIEKSIIKEVLVKDMQDFDKKVNTIKDKVISFKKTLTTLNAETTEKSGRYSKLFYDMTGPDSSKYKFEKKDLYMYEMSFLKCAFEQMKYSKKLAHEALDLWQECLKSECSRLESIKKSFSIYLSKYAEVFGKSPLIDIPSKILEVFDPIKETESQYQISKVLTADELNFIKKHLNCGDVTFKELQAFFEEFEIKDLPQKPLVKKEITILRDVGGFTKNFKECLFIITIDNNLLILDNPKEDEVNESTACLKIGNLSLVARKDPQLYDLTERVTGMLFDSTNKYLIKVADGDRMDELCHYLNLKR